MRAQDPPATLLDANVLIALALREHEHHDRASAWTAAAGPVALCPITEGALVRTLLRLGERAAAASELLRRFHASEQVEFWPDAVSYADLDLAALHGHRQATDAYLVGLATHHGSVLATLDAGLHSAHPHHSLLLPA